MKAIKRGNSTHISTDRQIDRDREREREGGGMFVASTSCMNTRVHTHIHTKFYLHTHPLTENIHPDAFKYIHPYRCTHT